MPHPVPNAPRAHCDFLDLPSFLLVFLSLFTEMASLRSISLSRQILAKAQTIMDQVEGGTHAPMLPPTRCLSNGQFYGGTVLFQGAKTAATQAISGGAGRAVRAIGAGESIVAGKPIEAGVIVCLLYTSDAADE